MSDSLDYYKDRVGHLDTYARPAVREGEKCLNCDKPHSAHSGWACDRNRSYTTYEDMEWYERYMTVSMRQSRKLAIKGAYSYKYDITSGELKAEYSTDTSNWRVWAKVPSGNCACNIPKHQCKYHGTAKVA